MGLNEQEIAALPADELQVRLALACKRTAETGAHFVSDTIAGVLPVIDQIQQQLAASERP